MNGTRIEKVSASLDLSGFTRRLPFAAIYWQLEQLKRGDALSLVFNEGINGGLIHEALGRCGAEVLLDDQGSGERMMLIRRRLPSGRILELDMRGRRCPVPVIESRRHMRTMKDGEQLRMVSDCTSAIIEMDTWAAHAPNVTLLDQWHQGNEHVFLLKRSQGHGRVFSL